MKMTYVKPETLAVAVMHFESLLLSQSENPRGVEGGVTEGSDGLPGNVGETDGETDPYDEHGQGSGGGGNRSKSGMIWDEW